MLPIPLPKSYIAHLLTTIALCCLLNLPLTAQQTLGLFQNDSLSFNGYTLFGNAKTTYLIDNCGYQIQQWASNYKPGLSAYLLPDGNLLRTANLNGDFNAGGTGGRFELFSWEGELLWHWSYADSEVHAHHDIAPLPNGNFLLLAWEMHFANEAKEHGFAHDLDIWSERIVEVAIQDNNTATIVWEWRLWDHLIQDADPSKTGFGAVEEHPERIDINYEGALGNNPNDRFHLNAIDYNPQLDQIVVSSRHYSEVWIIDHSTTTTEAAGRTGGLSGRGGDLLYRYGNPAAYKRGGEADQHLVQPHDARWIPQGMPYEGHLMIYNNKATFESSRIEIWAPPTDSNGDYLLNDDLEPNPVWTYEQPGFFSGKISGAHMLPNGNVLICEGEKGRFFEVSPDHQTVWEYINPINRFNGAMAQGADARFNETFRATRYAVDYPAFDNKTLTAGPPIEINPWDQTHCSYTFYEPPPVELEIRGNPFRETLIVHSNQPVEKIPLEVYDMHGRRMASHILLFGENRIDMPQLPVGVYVVLYRSKQEWRYLAKVVSRL